MSIYDENLPKVAANYQALTPLTYLERAAAVFPDQIVIVHGKSRTNYRDYYRRCRKLGSAPAPVSSQRKTRGQ